MLLKIRVFNDPFKINTGDCYQPWVKHYLHTHTHRDTNLSLELLHYMFEKVLIKIFSTQEGVSIGGFHLKNSLLDLQDRDIKRPAAKIIHSNSGIKTDIVCF